MKINELNAGDVVYPDDGFPCLAHNQPCTVAQSDKGLFVPCSDGKHYLDGQEDGDGELVGLSSERWPELSE